MSAYDRGQNLSGGQRQRISIARALLKDSPVLIVGEGHIVEMESHQELLLLAGLYAALHGMQFKV